MLYAILNILTSYLTTQMPNTYTKKSYEKLLITFVTGKTNTIINNWTDTIKTKLKMNKLLLHTYFIIIIFL